MHRSASMMFSAAVNWDMISKKPTEKFKMPKKKYSSDEEEKKRIETNHTPWVPTYAYVTSYRG